jgi:hypothetical protein
LDANDGPKNKRDEYVLQYQIDSKFSTEF